MNKKELVLGVGLASALVTAGLTTTTAHADEASHSSQNTSSHDTTTQSVTAQDISDAQTRVTKAEEQLNTEQKTLTDKESQLSTAHLELDSLNKQEEAIQADKNIIPDTLANKQKEVSDLEAKEIATHSDLTEVQQKANEITQKQEKAKQAVTEAHKVKSQAEEEVTAAQKKLEDAQKAFGSKAGEIDTLKKNIDQQTTAIKELEDKKIKAEAELKKAQETDKQLGQATKKLTADKNDAEQRLTKQTQERDSLEKQLSPLEKRLSEIENELAKLTTNTTLQIQPEDTSKYRQPEVGTPSDGNLLVGITGEFLTPDKQAILDELNRIRKEAYEQGIKYTDFNGNPHTIDKYVPLKWSKDLEDISLLRAAENSIYYEHKRLTGEKSVAPIASDGKAYPGSSLKPGGENLFVSSHTQPESKVSFFQDAINSWYEEKKDRLQGDYSSKKTGHYNSIIDPTNLYTSLSIFKNQSGKCKWPIAANQRFARQFNVISNPVSENLVGQYGPSHQLVEAPSSHISNVTLTNSQLTLTLGQTSRLELAGQLNFQNEENKPEVFHHDVSIFSDYTVTSDQPDIVTVQPNGSFIAKKVGTAKITARVGGQTFTAEITVQATSNANTEKLVAEQKNLKEKASQLRVKLDTSNQDIRQLISTIQKLTAQLNVGSATPSAQKKLEEATTNLDKAQKELQVLTERLKTLTASDADKKAALEQAQKLVNTAKEKLVLSQKALTKAQEQAEKTNQESETIQKELASRKLELENLQKQIAEGRQAINSMESILKDPSLLAKREAELTEKIARQKSNIQTLEAEITVQQEKVKEGPVVK